MVKIEQKITLYDKDSGELSRIYNRRIHKMIDTIQDIDLEQFDFDKVESGNCKELDNLVTELCEQSGLGSNDVYSLILDRFEIEYDIDISKLQDMLDTFKESCKTKNYRILKRKFKESKSNDYKYYVTYAVITLTKDNYEHGADINIENEWDLDIQGKYKSLKDIIKEVKKVSFDIAKEKNKAVLFEIRDKSGDIIDRQVIGIKGENGKCNIVGNIPDDEHLAKNKSYNKAKQLFEDTYLNQR